MVVITLISFSIRMSSYLVQKQALCSIVSTWGVAVSCGCGWWCGVWPIGWGGGGGGGYEECGGNGAACWWCGVAAGCVWWWCGVECIWLWPWPIVWWCGPGVPYTLFNKLLCGANALSSKSRTFANNDLLLLWGSSKSPYALLGPVTLFNINIPRCNFPWINLHSKATAPLTSYTMYITFAILTETQISNYISN